MSFVFTRKRNTTREGRAFSDAQKMQVWRKGNPISKYDQTLWRRDVCGNVMYFPSYGDTTSEHGWEIDHILPVSKGGGDQIDNLQPLQWENNRRKGDTYPWFCR